MFTRAKRYFSRLFWRSNVERPVFHADARGQSEVNADQFFASSPPLHPQNSVENGHQRPVKVRIGKTSFHFIGSASEHFRTSQLGTGSTYPSSQQHQSGRSRTSERKKKQRDAAMAFLVNQKQENARRKQESSHFLTRFKYHIMRVTQNIATLNDMIRTLQDIWDQVSDFSVTSIASDTPLHQDVVDRPMLMDLQTKVDTSYNAALAAARWFAYLLEGALQVHWTESFLLERHLTHLSFFESEMRQSQSRVHGELPDGASEQFEEDRRKYEVDYLELSSRRASATTNALPAGQALQRALRSIIIEQEAYEVGISRVLDKRIEEHKEILGVDRVIVELASKLNKIYEMRSRVNSLLDRLSCVYQDNTEPAPDSNALETDTDSIETVKEGDSEVKDRFVGHASPSILQQLFPHLPNNSPH